MLVFRMPQREQGSLHTKDAQSTACQDWSFP